MGYLFDTNIWIDLDWRKLPRDSFPSLWSRIETEIATGGVFTLDMVYDELQNTAKDDDRLASWVKGKRAEVRGFVIDSTSDIQTTAAALINKYKLKQNADPFLVAAAQKHGLSMVSHEKRMKPNEVPRVPNLCAECGVSCVTLLELIRQNDWTF
jgi:predicted nucleic acid-binding protein